MIAVVDSAIGFWIHNLTNQFLVEARDVNDTQNGLC